MAARMVDSIHALDEGAWPIVVGSVLAAVVAIAMVAKVDADLPILGAGVAIVAAFAPSAGLTALAALALLREPAGLGPLGFNATIAGACGLGVLARQAIGGWAGRQVTVRPEFAAVGAFVALSVVQFLRLATRTTAERERFGLTQLMATCAGLLIVILVPAVFTPANRRWLVVALVPGILVAAGAAIASLSPAVIGLLPLGGLLPPEDISARGTGIFRNPNYLGEAMALSFFVVARSRRMGLPTALGRHPILLAVPVAFAAVASFSRGALLALVGGVVSLYASRGRRALLIAAIAGVIVVGIGYPIILTARHFVNFGPRIEESGEAQAESDATRIAVVEAGVKLFLRQPVLGIGIGQFHFESVQYLNGSPVTFSHNQYLQIGVEQGILGMTAFIVMLVTLIHALSRVGDEYSETARSMLIVFAIGAVFAEPLTSMQTSGVLWVVVGAALVRAGRGGRAFPSDGASIAATTDWKQAVRSAVRVR
jgi:O-antigen ligase